MDILGIGPLELFFILLIALIVLGPKDMVKAGRTLGRVLRRIVTSPEWGTFQQASRELRQIPTRLMREAGIEELKREIPDINQIGAQLGINEVEQELDEWQKGLTDWTTSPSIINSPEAPALTQITNPEPAEPAENNE